MVTRRAVLASLIATPFASYVLSACAQEELVDESLTQLKYPSFDLLDSTRPFGNKPPTAVELARAREIIQQTPKGPTPIAVARSFVDRFYVSNPGLISQWPVPQAWNPLVVEFFRATNLKVNNDLVAWCAAFANWCLDRAGSKGSQSAASQSFLDPKEFKRTATPSIGDLAVFTCYKPGTNSSVGLGHVGFVEALPVDGKVRVLGGNQAADGKSSIICVRPYAIGDRSVDRTINGRRVPCTMRLNTYVKVAKGAS